MSFPADFIQQMQAILPEQHQQFFSALSAQPPVSARFNPAKIQQSPYPDSQPVPWAAAGFYLPERPNFTLNPLLHAGAFYVQEAGSMLLGYVLGHYLNQNPNPALAVDLCAAPGGKSTHLASLLPADCLLVSNELVKNRAAILVENLQKWGQPNQLIANENPQKLSEKLAGLADILLIDAPCSGEGMFRKDPASVGEWSAASVKHCAIRQKEILAQACQMLKEGGLLIYSTCTYNQLENEQIAEYLLQTGEFEPFELPDMPADWGISPVGLSRGRLYKCFPHLVQSEGFALCALLKTSPSRAAKAKKSKSISPLSNKQIQPFLGYFRPEAELVFINHQEQLRAFPAAHWELIGQLYEQMHIVYAGLTAGDLLKNELRPAHQLALSQVANWDYFQTWELDLETALRYLRLDPISPPAALPQGWVLLRYQNIPIGFIKNMPNRYNNYYPPNWKIRMGLEPLYS